MEKIPLIIVTEDILSRLAIEKILNYTSRFEIKNAIDAKGSGNIRSRIKNYNRVAKSNPVMVLTDLDQEPCPSELIQSWFKSTEKHPNFIFRIAVREIETWLMADSETFSDYTGIVRSKIILPVDTIPDPKMLLLNLITKSKKKEIREGLSPRSKSTARVGPLYNQILQEYIEKFWRVKKAAEYSKSLERAIRRLKEFSPTDIY